MTNPNLNPEGGTAEFEIDPSFIITSDQPPYTRVDFKQAFVETKGAVTVNNVFTAYWATIAAANKDQPPEHRYGKDQLAEQAISYFEMFVSSLGNPAVIQRISAESGMNYQDLAPSRDIWSTTTSIIRGILGSPGRQAPIQTVVPSREYL